MDFLEKKLNCAGFCQTAPWKSFSTIDRAFTQNKPCGNALYELIEANSRLYGIIFGLISIILLMTSVFAFCLCCHPDKKKNKQHDKGAPYHHQN